MPGVACLGHEIAHGGPAGRITRTSSNVFIEGKEVARVGDSATCADGHAVSLISQGYDSVRVGHLPVARKGDAVSCGARISEGSSTVFVGGEGTCYPTGAWPVVNAPSAEFERLYESFVVNRSIELLV